MLAPRNVERLSISMLDDAEAARRVVARTLHDGKPRGASRLVGVFETADEAKEAVDAHNARLNEKGPAEAATSPSHGPNNPYEENAVNTQQCNAAPAGAQPATEAELFSTAVDEAALAGLDLQQLSDLYDACRTMMNVVAGLGCQPRFAAGLVGHRFNPAGAQLDLFHELAAACLTAIVDEAEARKPSGREGALTRAWLLARDGAILCDDFAEFRAMIEREARGVTDDAGAEAIRPTGAAGDIKDWFAEWRALHERNVDGETSEENEANYARYAELQDLIVGAEAKTARDVAMQFQADSGARGKHHSKEFAARMLALATDQPSAAASAYDPFVDRMAIYGAEVQTFNQSVDDAAEDPGNRLCADIRSGKLAIGSRSGAALAIRRVQALDCVIDTEGDTMLEAVLTFLEGRS